MTTRFMVFANRKGGCGKTTTAVNTAHALANKGRKVLLLDVDPQSHASISLNHGGHAEGGVFRLLAGASMKDVISNTSVPGLGLVTGSRDLTAFEIDNSVLPGSETRLSECLAGPVAEYDYVILDPPPTVGLLTVMSLVAAREVYIPMQTHFLAMEGLAEMMRLIYSINAAWNPNLRLMGLIPTFYNKSTRIAKEIGEEIVKNFGEDKLFPGIRMNVSLAEAPGHGKTVLDYAPNSLGAKDYTALADRIDAVKEK